MKMTTNDFDTVVSLSREDLEAIRKTADIFRSIRNEFGSRYYLYADTVKWKESEIAGAETTLTELADYLEGYGISEMVISY